MGGLRSRVAELDALVFTAGIWFLAKLLRYAFPPLFPTFKTTFGVNEALLGTAFTAMMLVYAAMQFPAGALADRFGPTRVIAVGGAIATTAGLVLAFDAPLPGLIAGMLLVGAGTGVHKTVAVRLLSGVYPRRTGRMLGVLDTFGTFGGIAAPAIVVAVTDTTGWRSLFLAAGFLGVALVVGFLRRVPRRVPEDLRRDEDESDGLDPRQYAALFADRRIATFLLATVAFSFGYNGVVSFLPLYLVDAGLGETTANLLFSGLFVVSVVQPLSGDLSDRFGALRVLGGTLALAAVGLGGLLALSGPLALGAAVIVFGVGSHGYRPVRGAYLMDILPDSAAGGGLGVVRTILMGAGAIAPAIVGYLSGTAGYAAAFGLLGASMLLAFIAVVAVALLPEREAPGVGA